MGSMTLLGCGKAPGVVSSAYLGPGDVQSGAVWWGGLRGYNLAYATGSNPAVDLVDQAGANALTGVVIKTDGTLDVSSVATWVAANSVTTIRVSKLYDQSGGGNHAVQATLASMPQLILGPVTGLASNRPAIAINGGRFLQTAAISGANLIQPMTLSAVGIRTSGTTLGGMIGGTTTDDAEIFFDGANLAGVYAAVIIDAAQTDNAWHGFHGVFNDPLSLMNVDGVDGTSGTAGAHGWTRSGTGAVVIGKDGFGSAMVGNLCEVGAWNISFTTAAKSAAMSSNQHSYWGF